MKKIFGSVFITAATGLLMSSLGFVFSAPVRADLILCNKARTKYLTAVTWTAPGGNIRSSGWMQIQPGQCQPAGFSGDTSNSTFGVYGENVGGGFHRGDTPRCVILFPTQRCCTGKGRVIANFKIFRNVSSDKDQRYFLYD